MSIREFQETQAKAFEKLDEYQRAHYLNRIGIMHKMILEECAYREPNREKGERRAVAQISKMRRIKFAESEDLVDTVLGFTGAGSEEE